MLRNVRIIVLVGWFCVAPALAQCEKDWAANTGALAIDPVGDIVVFDPDGAGPQPELVCLALPNPGNTLVAYDGSVLLNIGAALAGGTIGPRAKRLIVFDGRLIVGGDFDSAGGVPARHVAAWDGTQWYALGNGLDAGVRDFAVYNGKLYASSWVGSSPHVLQWNGVQWQSIGQFFGSGNSLGARVLGVFDGDLIAAGWFDSVSGARLAEGIARWDGTKWYDMVQGSKQSVTMAVYRGELIVGLQDGRISAYDGSTWRVFPNPPMALEVLVVFDGELIAGGWLNDDALIAAWDGLGWHDLGAGVGYSGAGSGQVEALAVQDKRLIVGGEINLAGGQPTGNWTFWVCSCYADCDQSTGNGVLDVFDFLCFQNSFVNSEPYACDCDTSTGNGVCDVFDFLCFQNAFVGGCP